MESDGSGSTEHEFHHGSSSNAIDQSEEAVPSFDEHSAQATDTGDADKLLSATSDRMGMKVEQASVPDEMSMR